MSEYIPIKVSSETLLALLPQNLQTDELYIDFVKAISYVFNRSVYENLTISENIRDPNFLNANLLDLTAKYLGFSYSSSITDTPTLLNLIPLLGTIYKTKGTNYVEDLFSYVFDTRINIIPIWVQFFRGDKSNPLNYKPTSNVASLTGFYDPSNAYVTNGVPDYSKIYYYTPVDGNYIESCYVVLNLSQQVDYTKLLSFCNYILNKNLVVIGIGNLSNYTGYLTFVDSMNNNIEVTQYVPDTAVNYIQSDYDRAILLGNLTSYNIQESDGFALISKNGTSPCIYRLPDASTLTVGFTICIFNQGGTITDGVYSVNQSGNNINGYTKCETSGSVDGNNTWIIDQQPISSYVSWSKVDAANSLGKIKFSMQNSEHSTTFGTWLICDGSTFSPTLYPKLYTLLGSTNLPNITGKIIAMCSTGNPAGTSAGEELVNFPLPYHTHATNDPSHSHDYNASNSSGGDWNGLQTANWANGNEIHGDATGTSSTGYTGISLNNAGTVSPSLPVTQPTFYATNAFIFAK